MREDFEALRSKVAALEQLLEVHERVALEQSENLEEVISERDAALQVTETQRTQLLDLLERMPAAVSVFRGPEIRLTFANSKAREIAGERVNQIGLTLAQLFPEVEQQGYVQMFREVYRSGEPFLAAEAKIDLEEQGSVREGYFDLAVMPMRNASGEVEAVLSFAYEVTEKVATRLELERLAGRMKNLSEASLEINAATSMIDVLRTVCTWAKELTSAERVVVSVGAHESGAVTKNVMVSEGGDEDAMGRSDPFGLDRVLDQEKAAIHLSRSQIEAAGADAPLLDVVGEWVGAPLSTHEDSPQGSIQVTVPMGSSFDRHAAAILTQLSQIAAVAIENVRTYQREHRIAETLQRSLLPQELPAMRHFRLDTAYIAGADGVSVGGDWYDAIDLGDGRVGVVLGDVVGKGVRAATLMSQFRNALRAFAMEGDPPAKVAQRLDRMIQKLNPETMATLIYGILDDGGGTFTFTNAGHLPPVLCGPAHPPELVREAMSVPIGVAPDIERYDSTLELPEGYQLILYTDGLVERRNRSIEIGLEELIDVIDYRMVEDQTIERITSKMLGSSGPEDDVAILLVQRTP